MSNNNLFSKIWYNKKHRNIAILSILLSFLAGIVLYQIFHTEPVPPPGAMRVVACKKCNYVGVMRITEIEKAKCPKCGGPLGYAWKCGKCKYQYSVSNEKIDTKNMNTMDRFRAALKMRKCPNCGEEKDIHPMTVEEFQKDHK